MSTKNQQEIATPQHVLKRTPTKTVVYIATMVAVSIVLKLVTNSISAAVPPWMKISFAYLGWYLSAAILGPWLGGAVACISDLLGQWLIPTGGAPNPILIAGNGLSAVIFGWIFKYVRIKNLTFFWEKVVLAAIGATASALVCTLGINTLGLWLYYFNSSNYLAFTLSRLVQLPAIIVNLILFIGFLPVLKNMSLIEKNE